MDIQSIETFPGKIEIKYTDGSREEIEAGIYERKNSSGRTVEERPVTAADLQRLTDLAASFEASVATPSAEVVKVEVLGSYIEVTYADGSKEEISGGVCELKGPDNETIIERAATDADISRLSDLASGAGGNSPDDDGTPDQGSGDATSTPGSDDGTPDQGSGDATPTPGSDDGTPDQGSGDAGNGSSDDSAPSGVTETGDDGDDRLRGSHDDDALEGGAGDDDLRGRSGDDTLGGGDGDDRMRGDHGDDTMAGGSGHDRMYGGGGSDTMRGDDGDDRMRGNRGGDDMDGGDGADHMRGGGNGDWMNGGAGDDYVLGEGGRDVVSGGAGNDNLYGGWSGGAGDGQQDTFVFVSTADGGGGYDRIRDFENGIDLIDLTSFGFTDVSEVLALAEQQSDDTILCLGEGDTLRIEDTALTELDASDFLL